MFLIFMFLIKVNRLLSVLKYVLSDRVRLQGFHDVHVFDQYSGFCELVLGISYFHSLSNNTVLLYPHNIDTCKMLNSPCIFFFCLQWEKLFVTSSFLYYSKIYQMLDLIAIPFSQINHHYSQGIKSAELRVWLLFSLL